MHMCVPSTDFGAHGLSGSTEGKRWHLLPPAVGAGVSVLCRSAEELKSHRDATGCRILLGVCVERA